MENEPAQEAKRVFSGATSNVVPFGRYRGRSVEDLLDDRDYCSWLTTQPDIVARYPDIYRAITGDATPEGSPEHNEMQAAFLNPEHRLALSRFVFGDRDIKSTGDPKFEVDGWDVVFWPREYRIKRLEPCRIEMKSLDWRWGRQEVQVCVTSNSGSVLAYEKTYGGAEGGEVLGYNDPGCIVGAHTEYTTVGRNRFLSVELKPSIGDDFPQVLRQVKRYMYDEVGDYGRKRKVARKGTFVVLVRRVAFSTVTLDQVKAMFRAEGIRLVLESELSP